jgi:CBS-domain-containing membrane protein
MLTNSVGLVRERTIPTHMIYYIYVQQQRNKFRGLSPRANYTDSHDILYIRTTTNKQIPWPESASELCRPSDRRLSAKLVPTFADGGCHMVSVTDPYGRILGFLDRSRYILDQLAPEL